MLYKIGSMGYFGGVAKVSRGPWFRDYWVEDDGLDWFYTFLNNDSQKCYLLSNNMSIEDRNKMSHLYHTMVRNNRISWFAGSWLAFEIVTRDSYFRKLALGWKGVNCLLMAFVFKSVFMSWSSGTYGPIMGAYLRKYQDHIKTDLFHIKDAKKEYFYIDTSEYMNYNVKDLGDENHCHHGPQPVSKFLAAITFLSLNRRANPLTAAGSQRSTSSSGARRTTSRTTRDSTITTSNLSTRASHLQRRLPI